MLEFQAQPVVLFPQSHVDKERSILLKYLEMLLAKRYFLIGLPFCCSHSIRSFTKMLWYCTNSFL